MRFRDRCILAWFGPAGSAATASSPPPLPPEEYAGEGWYRGEPWRFAGPRTGRWGGGAGRARLAAADVVEWLVRRFGSRGGPSSPPRGGCWGGCG
eukprot:tig00001025_g6362.t1